MFPQGAWPIAPRTHVRLSAECTYPTEGVTARLARAVYCSALQMLGTVAPLVDTHQLATLRVKWKRCAGLRSTLSMADINEGFVKNTESTFGRPDDSREAVRNARRVVVKARASSDLAARVEPCEA